MKAIFIPGLFFLNNVVPINNRYIYIYIYSFGAFIQSNSQVEDNTQSFSTAGDPEVRTKYWTCSKDKEVNRQLG